MIESIVGIKYVCPDRGSVPVHLQHMQQTDDLKVAQRTHQVIIVSELKVFC